MRKLSILGFVLALAMSAMAQPRTTTQPNARGNGVPPNAHPGPTATNSTVNVPPVAKVPPVATRGNKGK